MSFWFQPSSFPEETVASLSEVLVTVAAVVRRSTWDGLFFFYIRSAKMGILIPFTWGMCWPTWNIFIASSYYLLLKAALLVSGLRNNPLEKDLVGLRWIVTIIVAVTFWKCCISTISVSIDVWTEGGLLCTSSVLIHCRGNANFIASGFYIKKSTTGSFVTKLQEGKIFWNRKSIKVRGGTHAICLYSW